jgi:hypothetical protein
MYGKCCGVQTNIKSRDVRVMVGLIMCMDNFTRIKAEIPEA